MVSLALGSFAGPLTLARFFDSVGRRPMIVTSLRRVGRAARRHGFALPGGRALRAERRSLESIAKPVTAQAAG
jgi:hypothetical protein